MPSSLAKHIQNQGLDVRSFEGFWLWEVKDMDEAVKWVKRCPNPMPDYGVYQELR